MRSGGSKKMEMRKRRKRSKLRKGRGRSGSSRKRKNSRGMRERRMVGRGKKGNTWRTWKHKWRKSCKENEYSEGMNIQLGFAKRAHDGIQTGNNILVGHVAHEESKDV